MLPTTGDRVAAERPERAVPTASDVLPAPRTAPRAAGGTLPPAPLQTVRPPAAASAAPAGEPQGCLYALSQPPLMLFLLVIGGLLGLGAAYDLLFL